MTENRANIGNKGRGGQWLSQVVLNAALKTSSVGSTTTAVASVIRDKMAYYTLGDSILRVYRPLQTTQGFATVFESRDLSTTVRSLDGNAMRLPRQLAIMHSLARNDAYKLIDEGDYGVVKVQANDVVIVASDGISDNISEVSMKNIIRTEYYKGAGPKKIAGLLVDTAIRSNIKPDDVSCVIAFVV